MEKLLELLKYAFEMEYTDTFLYLKEAEMFKRKIIDGEKLANIFEKFSQMELRHADSLAKKIIELGGEAKWDFRPIEVSTSLRETLKRHLENEYKTYQLYEEIIVINKDLDFKLILQGIQRNEKEHLKKIIGILKKIRPFRRSALEKILSKIGFKKQNLYKEIKEILDNLDK